MAIRFHRARQSQQRLGISKLIAMYSEDIDTAAEATQLLRNKLTHKVKIPPDEAFLNWLKEKSNSLKNGDGEPVNSQIQYYYIYKHPSQSGWLSKHAFKEYATSFPRKLNIVDSSYDITDMGQVLQKALLDSSEKSALEGISEDLNPLVLSREQKIFYLYNVLVLDGDFFIPFAHKIFSEYSTRFKYVDAGNLIPRVIDPILFRFSGSAYSSSDREQLLMLEKMKEIISQNIQDKIERMGSGSRREQECITRLEWMVDLGILSKTSSRIYKFTGIGKHLVSQLDKYYTNYIETGYADQALQKVLDHDFFKIIAFSYFSNKDGILPQDKVILYLQSSYVVLRGLAGYCLFRPLLLLANIQNLTGGQQHFLEYDDGVKLVEGAFRENPHEIYYTTDRFGSDIQVKFP